MSKFICSLLTLTGQFPLQTTLELTDRLLAPNLVLALSLALGLQRGQVGRDVIVLAPGIDVLLQAELQGRVLVVLGVSTR